MGEVVELNLNTFVDIPPEKVLRGVIKKNFRDVLVIGREETGEMHFASSSSNIGVNLLLVERFKQEILDA